MVVAAEILPRVGDRLGAGEMQAAMSTSRHRLGPACGGRRLAAPVRCAHQRVDHGNNDEEKEELCHGLQPPAADSNWSGREDSNLRLLRPEFWLLIRMFFNSTGYVS